MIVFNLCILLTFAFMVYTFPNTVKKENQYLDRDATATLRGVAIIGIILHHIALHTNYDVNTIPGISLLINECGYPCTAIFFLFSGYGCWLSLKKGVSIHKQTKVCEGGCTTVLKWLFKHVLQLYTIYFLTLIIALVVYYSFTPNSTTVSEVLKYIPTMQFSFQHHWFPIIQVLCYVIISVSFVLSEKRGDIIVLLLVIAYMVIARLCGLPTFWYNSVIAFSIGVFFAKHGRSIVISKKKNLVICIISGGVFGIMLVAQAFLYSRSYIVSDIIRVLSSAILCIFVITLTRVYSINSNLLKIIGNASFECFFLHWIGIQTLKYYEIESNLAVLVIMISTIIVSIVIHKIVLMIFGSRINRKKVD